MFLLYCKVCQDVISLEPKGRVSVCRCGESSGEILSEDISLTGSAITLEFRDIDFMEAVRLCGLYTREERPRGISFRAVALPYSEFDRRVKTLKIGQKE
jgi:hypothetical protein